MKNKLFTAVLACIILFSSSCATVFGGRITQCQRTKPERGEPSRPIRVVALLGDIFLFWPGIIVDFADNAIYKPCRNGAFVRPVPENKRQQPAMATLPPEKNATKLK
jgi:hypothetical protein